MKKVLVTGAGGMLGKELVCQLKELEEIYIYAVSSGINQIRAVGENLVFVPISQLEHCLQSNEIDCLVHLAFPRNVKPDQWADGITYASNVLKLAKQYEISQIIHVSSQSLYGWQRTFVAREMDSVILTSPYTTGKFCLELMTNTLFEDRPHTNIRLSTIVGTETEERVPNKFLRRLVKGDNLVIEGGMQRFSFLDSRDAASALCKMVVSDGSEWAEVYNLGTWESYSLIEIAEEAVSTAKEYGFSGSEIIVKDAEIPMNNALNAELFMRDFDWKPQYTLKQTMTSILERIIRE